MTMTVLSFMSSFSNRDSQSSPTQSSAAHNKLDSFRHEAPRQDYGRESLTPPGLAQYQNNMSAGESPQPRIQRERAPSRPMSMVQTYQPPLMDVSQDTLPELQPIFTFLNSHSNKLYQEGYFLKLDDQNTRTYLVAIKCLFLISCRRESQCGPNLDGMFRSTCWDSLVVVGRGGVGCSWSRWGGSTQIYQPDRCLHQNGKTIVLIFMTLLT
jgi:hypothetical protein